MANPNAVFDEALLSQFDTVWVGFSGGLDSTVLLHQLAQHPPIKSKLKAIHFNHQISSQAAHWQTFTQQVSQQLTIPYLCLTATSPIAKHQNTEELARNARYEGFDEHIGKNDCLVLAHHQSDQAETVLYRLFRGTGIDGLAAMRMVSRRKHYQIYRPFLEQTKAQLEDYAKKTGLSWLTDDSNEDQNYDRNFIRKQLLPLIKARFPAAEKKILQTAKLCQQHVDQTKPQITKLLNLCRVANTDNKQLCAQTLLNHNQHQQALIIRAWLQQHNLNAPSNAQLTIFLTSLSLAAQDKHPELQNRAYLIRFDRKRLYLLNQQANTKTNEPIVWHSPYPNTHSACGQYLLTLTPCQSNGNIYIPAKCLITIRQRQGGEKVQYQGLRRKLKKCLQALDIPAWQRSTLPILYINDTFASFSDLLVADDFNKSKGNNYILKCTPTTCPEH